MPRRRVPSALKTKGAALDDTGTLALGTALALTAGTLDLENGGMIAGGADRGAGRHAARQWRRASGGSNTPARSI